MVSLAIGFLLSLLGTLLLLLGGLVTFAGDESFPSPLGVV